MTPEDANADRAKMREAIEELRADVTRMRGIARLMAANVTLLTEAQQRTTRRVSKRERRVDGLE